MYRLYFVLAAIHLVAVVVTGILWTLLDLGYGPKLRPHLRDIRAVHFGSLYLVRGSWDWPTPSINWRFLPGIRLSSPQVWGRWYSWLALPTCFPAHRGWTRFTTGPGAGRWCCP
jgi:hypothetical protein